MEIQSIEQVACKGCTKTGEEDSFNYASGDLYCDPCVEAFVASQLPKLDSFSDEVVLQIADEMLRLSGGGGQPIRALDRCRDEALGVLGDIARAAQGN